jgi:hypothetical protein
LKFGLLDLGAFLDIKGSFDCTTFESMFKAAEEHGVEQVVIRWIHTMPGSCQIMTVHMGCMMRVSAGVVLSSLPWSLVVHTPCTAQ